MQEASTGEADPEKHNMSARLLGAGIGSSEQAWFLLLHKGKGVNAVLASLRDVHELCLRVIKNPFSRRPPTSGNCEPLHPAMLWRRRGGAHTCTGNLRDELNLSVCCCCVSCIMHQ